MKHRLKLENGIVKFATKFKYLLHQEDRQGRIVAHSTDENNFTKKKLKVKKQHYSKLKGDFLRIIICY